jgi:hypothetical protein
MTDRFILPTTLATKFAGAPDPEGLDPSILILEPGDDIEEKCAAKEAPDEVANRIKAALEPAKKPAEKK